MNSLSTCTLVLAALVLLASSLPLAAQYRFLELEKVTADVADFGGEFGNDVDMGPGVAIVGYRNDDSAATLAGSAYVYRYNVVDEVWEEEQILTASNAATADRFGHSVAIDDGVCVIGAPFHNLPGMFDAGSAYVFRYNETDEVWEEEAILTASDAANTDWFGVEVAIEGDLLVVCAERDDEGETDSGSVYVFRYDETTETWEEEQKITPATATEDGGFGMSLSTHEATVERIAIGEPNASTVDGDNVGRAHVYTYNVVDEEFQLSDTFVHPTPEEGDGFGFSVSLHSYSVAVGCPYDDEGGPNIGSAFVFTYDSTTGDWEQRGDAVRASDPIAGGQLGRSVSINGDLVVGSNEGAFYYDYDYDDEEWIAGHEDFLWSDTADNDYFGDKISHGWASARRFALTSAFRDDDVELSSGSAYFMRLAFDCNRNEVPDRDDVTDGTSEDCNDNDIPDECENDCNDNGIDDACDIADGTSEDCDSNGIPDECDVTRLEAVLTASDGDSLDQFGWAVDISGDVAVCGAFTAESNGDPITALNNGAAYVYRRDPVAGDWQQEAILNPSTDPFVSESFGISVAVDDDVIAVVGNNIGTSGKVVVFRYDSVFEIWEEEQVLTTGNESNGLPSRFYTVSIEGDVIAVGSPYRYTNEGAVFMYRYDSTSQTWSEEQELRRPAAELGANFGWSVSLSDGAVLVGAPGDDAVAVGAGAAYLFCYDSDLELWDLDQKFFGSETTSLDEFGEAVSLDGDVAVIGAHNTDSIETNLAGKAYIFRRDEVTENWVEQAILTGDESKIALFGDSVSVDGDTVLVGAPFEDDIGATYAYFYLEEVGKWSSSRRLHYDGVLGDRFGKFVVADSTTLVVGTPSGPTGLLPGKAVIYDTTEDLDNNGVPDLCDDDCDENGRTNLEEIEKGAPDCNENGVPDRCDIDDETSLDKNLNGIPDECEGIREWRHEEPNPRENDRFGDLVGLYQDLAIVRVTGDDKQLPDSGSLAVYGYNSGNRSWDRKATLAPKGKDVLGDRGASIHKDEDAVAAFGATKEDGSEGGTVSVFRKRADSKLWVGDGRLEPSDSAAGDDFGRSLAMTKDRIVVGAPSSDEDGSSGSVYVFDYNKDEASWDETDKLVPAGSYESFGITVDVVEDRIFVSSRDDTGVGAVHIFLNNTITDAWTEEQKIVIIGDTAGLGDSISGRRYPDGARFLAIGAKKRTRGSTGILGEVTEAGAVFIYRFDEDTLNWEQEAEIFASDAATDAEFGASVSLEANGLLVTGAPGHVQDGDATGAVYTFRYNPAQDDWIEGEQYLPEDGNDGDRFGASVSVSEGYAWVGAPGDSDTETEAGAAYTLDLATDCNDNGILDDLEDDCNNNGIPDDCDITYGWSLDEDEDGIPDECADSLPEFLRGDCDGNGSVFAIIDALYLLEYGFINGPTPPCLDAADVDGNDSVFPIIDALYLLEYGFTNGPAPPSPGPASCGPDEGDDSIDCAVSPGICS